MSLPMTAVGPLNVETKPILIVSPARAGFARARAVAPASQNAVLIVVSLLIIAYAANQSTCAVSSNARRLYALFCARNGRPAASTNRRLPLRTFGSVPVVAAP